MKEKHSKYFIRHAEEVTGYPVVLVEDPNLPVTTSSSSDISEFFRRRKFVIRYNQENAEHIVDHAICNEAIYITRVWDAVKKQEYKVMKTARSALKAVDDIQRMLTRIPTKLMIVMAPALRCWQLSELYCIPIAIRNEQKISRYEWYREVQNVALSEVLSQKARQLEREEKTASGYKMEFHDNVKALYSAMALGFSPLISREDGRSEITRPFEEHGDIYKGEELIQILNEIPDSGHGSDIRTIDLWAEKLGLDGWYEWASELGIS